jgi:tRNA (guanosine-2'-O-)-methyltransferase
VVAPAGRPGDDERVIARLEPLLTEARRARLQAALAARSDHVAFVFERMVDPHNLSAALRSLDAFGFQDVHLVAPGDRVELARGITIGAERWLTLHDAPDTATCIRHLKRAGYRVYASRLEDTATPLTELDFARRTALVFGNEHRGVSREALAHADGAFRIGMLGFAQSLNLSVAAAISAHHARRELERLVGIAAQPERFHLGAERRRALYAQWLRQSVKHAERILGEVGL